jgi:ribosome-binding ATPase YchF (GTP1/OBG family)
MLLQFLTAKPVVYLVNLSERDYQRKKNKWLPKLFEWVKASSSVVHCTAAGFAGGPSH